MFTMTIFDQLSSLNLETNWLDFTSQQEISSHSSDFLYLIKYKV